MLCWSLFLCFERVWQKLPISCCHGWCRIGTVHIMSDIRRIESWYPLCCKIEDRKKKFRGWFFGRSGGQMKGRGGQQFEKLFDVIILYSAVSYWHQKYPSVSSLHGVESCMFTNILILLFQVRNYSNVYYFWREVNLQFVSFKIIYLVACFLRNQW